MLNHFIGGRSPITVFGEVLEPRELLAASGVLLPQNLVETVSPAFLPGDMNGDQALDNFDIGPFELALSNPSAFLAENPGVLDYASRGDINADGSFDNHDIDAMSHLLTEKQLGQVGVNEAPAAAAVAIQPGVWMSAAQILSLPTTGTAWKRLVSDAAKSTGTPDISNQDEDADVLTLAKALIGVRQNNAAYLAQVRANVMAAIGTESDGRSLALGRNLASYVIAADLAKLSPTDDVRFRAWLRTTLSENLDGDTLRSTHELRANNWGTMAGASRAAVAVYLGDAVELARVAKVFKGWLGDRTSYAGFKFGDMEWQANPSAPVGINPTGATKQGHSIDGALPEEMRRGGPFKWPPAYTNYPWGALQGVVVQAEILYRAGHDTWQWGNRAILRAVQYLYSIGWSPVADDQWIVSLVNARYGTTFGTNLKASPGKIMGWTAWTHQKAAVAAASAPSAGGLAALALSPSVNEDIDQNAGVLATDALQSPVEEVSTSALPTVALQTTQASAVRLARPIAHAEDATGVEPAACDHVLSELEAAAPSDGAR